MATRYTRLLRFTAVLAVVIYVFVHRSFSKERHQAILELKEQLHKEQHDLHSELVKPATGDDQGIKVEYRGEVNQSYERENAVLFTLARNKEVAALARTVQSFEDRFNRKFHYPWVFANNEPFSDQFKRQMTALVSGEVKFVEIPHEFWGYPDWVDQKKALIARRGARGEMMYGGSESYRLMCRFFSGFFYKLEVMKQYDYSWRVEPGTELLCDINYDVFKFMRSNDKHYGFAVSIHEFPDTIKTLWKAVSNFIGLHSRFIAQDNLLPFISFDQGKSYNLCHFWTNFEIADLNFFRSTAYETFFQFLDSTGGFFYERWGDAPVHSIAVSLFMSKSDVHFFDDVGYFHTPSTSCPINDEVWVKNRCICDQAHDVTFREYSCVNEFYEITGKKKPDGWESHRGNGDYFD